MFYELLNFIDSIDQFNFLMKESTNFLVHKSVDPDVATGPKPTTDTLCKRLFCKVLLP